MRHPRKLLVIVVGCAAMLVWLLLAYPQSELRHTAGPVGGASPVAAPKPPPPAPAVVVTTPAQPALEATTAPTPEAPKSPGTVGTFAIPREGKRARHRTMAKATWGTGDGQLGLDYLAGGRETYTPQGFVPTRDGKLIVLDSNNRRLVEYDRRGRVERTLSVAPLVMPADVALAQDGTLIVVDHPGVQTGGLLLIRPDGSRRSLPAIQADEMYSMYAVGNDFYFEVMEGSVKGGNTSGDLSDETPGVYNYEDQEVVPGHVAPDGKTVISRGAEEGALERGEFYVSAIRGEPPEHLFTHHLVWPRALSGFRYSAADEQGRIYVVVIDGPSGDEALVCLDPQGHPVGAVNMGKMDRWPGRTLREYGVAPEGGLVIMHPSSEGVQYDWYGCH